MADSCNSETMASHLVMSPYGFFSTTTAGNRTIDKNRAISRSTFQQWLIFLPKRQTMASKSVCLSECCRRGWLPLQRIICDIEICTDVFGHVTLAGTDVSTVNSLMKCALFEIQTKDSRYPLNWRFIKGQASYSIPPLDIQKKGTSKILFIFMTFLFKISHFYKQVAVVQNTLEQVKLHCVKMWLTAKSGFRI